MNYLFVAKQSVPAGYAERIGITSPHNVQQVWQYISQNPAAFRIPPGVAFQPTLLRDQSGPQTSVFCIQIVQGPTVAPAQVSAPYADPYGNRGQQSAPPIQPPGSNQPRPPDQRGAMEEIPDAALPGNADPMLGDIDGLGGTYSDIDGQGRETIRPRDMCVEASVPVQQRNG